MDTHQILAQEALEIKHRHKLILAALLVKQVFGSPVGPPSRFVTPSCMANYFIYLLSDLS